MPIKMICEKRHHLGESDINYPVVFCDICSKRIADAANAGYYYRHDNPASNDEDAYYKMKSDVYFLHHDCYWKVKSHYNKHGHFGVETEFGTFLSENIFPSSWGNMPAFPVFMGRNLSMEINADSAWKCQFDENEGKEINENTYPSHPDGYVYFIVDNGSITRKVKIGFSTNIHERLKDLQVGSPTILKCYGAIRGTKEDEKLAHKLLQHHNSHGEWFVFNKVNKVIDEWIEIGKICSIVVEAA